MKRADQITGVVLLCGSVVVCLASWRMPQSADFGPGVGFLPFWLGVAMAILSVCLIANATRQPVRSGAGSVFPDARALLNVGALLAGLCVYILLIETTGFALMTVLFVTYLLRIVQREKWVLSVVIGILATAGLYVIFDIILAVKLPKNIFGF